MMQQIKRLKRPCKDCQKIYQPNNRYGKICSKCMKKALDTNKRNKDNSKKILPAKIIMLLLIVILNLNFISALRVDSVDSGTVYPGEVSTIKIYLENNGDYDIRDVSVELQFEDLPFVPYNSNSEDEINKIVKGEIGVVEFKIISTNAKSGFYKIPLRISYVRESDVGAYAVKGYITTDEKVQVKESLISIIANSEPVISVKGSGENVLIKGKISELSVMLYNKGLSDIQFVEIEIENNIEYIGVLDGNDWESADFKIFIDENAPNPLTVSMIIRYQDFFNKEYEKELELIVNTYTTRKAKALGLLPSSKTPRIVGGLIILFIGIFVFRWIKKKRKLKRKENWK